jgi:hypothetical protein
LVSKKVVENDFWNLYVHDLKKNRLIIFYHHQHKHRQQISGLALVRPHVRLISGPAWLEKHLSGFPHHHNLHHDQQIAGPEVQVVLEFQLESHFSNWRAEKAQAN